jgi:PAS domain S-box-containing protein
VVDYAIFLLDVDGRVRTWNPGAERLKGYTSDEIVGRHYSAFYPAELRDELPERMLEEAREQGRVRHSGWRVRKDGSRFWADVVLTALYDDGVLRGFAKVTRDMTEAHAAEQRREAALVEQQQAVERLEQLDEWRRDFLRSITHDLQGPVTALRGFVKLLLDEQELSPGDQREFVERLESNVGSLQSLIDHLRTANVLESGRVNLEPEEVGLASFVAELTADMQPVIGDVGVVLAVPPDLSVLADRPGLERILRNLLGNAARHTSAAGTITVSATMSEEAVTVEVSDTGEGIAEEALPHVFDRFQRGEGGGTGLGLAIVREYVELHGGTVSVDSRRGEGSTFRFTLPRP